MKNNPARRPTKGKKRKAKALDAMEDIDPLDTLILDKITIHIARKYGSTAYLIPQVTLARYVERIRSHPEMPFILDPWQEDLCQRLEQAFWCANARKFRFTKVEIAGKPYAVAPNGFRIDAAEFNRKENLGTLAAIHAPPQFGKSNIIAIAYPEIGGSGGTLAYVCRLVLREILWCKLESTNGFYIHFGYDYYMYVGSPVSSQRAIDYGKQNGLYVEDGIALSNRRRGITRRWTGTRQPLFSTCFVRRRLICDRRAEKIEIELFCKFLVLFRSFCNSSPRPEDQKGEQK